MTTLFLPIIAFCSLLVTPLVNSEIESSNLSTRRKRYVVFPEGSSFSIALCMTVHTLTPDSIFTEGLNWGISYDLPNETKPELDPFLQLRRDRVESDKRKKINHGNQEHSYLPSTADYDGQKFMYKPLTKGHEYYKTPYHQHYLQRRYRRNLYDKIELVINAMGFDGRKCILRALCEASQRLVPRGKTLIEEMIRVVFAMPVEKLLPFEPEEHHAYARAYAGGHDRGTRDCPALFPECSFSLIDMALGAYSPNEPTDYDDGDPATMAASALLSQNLRFTMK